MGDLRDETVLEIGPGQGAITRALTERAAHVIAIELDPHLAARLRDQFPAERLSVLEEDVLQVDFAALSANAGKRIAVAGNLPYYITSPILLKLAASHAVLDRAVLMVQREVADRVVAAPGSRDYGLLSVTVQMYGPVERLFTLPPDAFSPPPNVHSTVFRWRFAPRFAELGVQEESFLSVARHAFAQKRKTLANNLRAAGYRSELIHCALSAASIPPQARAEALSIQDMARLSILFENEKAASASEAAIPFEKP
jgi:16S rRNA (adenine1518-N6/adenine1519-N6)-dimethyltransferase